MSLVIPFDVIFSQEKGLLARHRSWKRVPLQEIARVQNGEAFKSKLFSKEKGFPLIRIRDLAGSKTETFYTGPYRPESVVNRGDLLIGMDGDFACHEWQGNPGLLNQRVCKIIPDDRVLDRKFLLYGINGYLEAIKDATSSQTVTHLSSLDVLRIPFPLPTLSEQQRIVAKVDALMARVNAVRQRLAKVPAILKRFRQAVLAAACSGRLSADLQPPSNGEWSEGRLGDLISDGPQNGLYRPRDDYGEGTLIVRIDNFYDGTIQPWRDLERLRISAKEKAAYGLREGDILINRVNSLSFLGKSALVTNLKETCVFESNMMRLSVDQNRVSPYYLIKYLNSVQGLIELRKNAKHAVNQASINQKDVADTIVPLPPMAEQHEIVRRVEDLFRLADAIEKRAAAATARAEKLTQAVLAKAFRGELVPTEAELARTEGRDYEPASELLKRIRSQRGLFGDGCSGKAPSGARGQRKPK